MPPLKSTVEINGYVVRALRERDGLSMQEIAEKVGEALGHEAGDETASKNAYTYVRKIETGNTHRVSPKVFNALLAAFSLSDRRVLLANPHGLEDVA